MIGLTPHIEYVDKGSGPALVLVHGLGGNLQNWLANIPTLAAHHRVIALDLPGFGRSDPLTAGVTMASYTDAAIGLLDRLGVASATFVGNSMGGLLTIEAAARHPDRVDAAVLACSGGIPLTTWRHRRVILPLGRALNRALHHQPVRHTVLRHPVTRRAIASGILHDARKVDPARLIPALDGLGASGFGPALQAALRYDARERAPHVRCPTLILWGRRDRLLPLRMGAQLHELISGSELVVWDDAGHCPMIEHPERFDALVSGFVNGSAASRSVGEPLSSAGYPPRPRSGSIHAMSSSTVDAPSTIAVRCPADGTIAGSAPEHTPAKVANCVARVRAAQSDWEALRPAARAVWLGRYRDWLLDHDVELAELLQRETGKTWQEATFEVPFGLDVINYYAKNAARFLADGHPRPHGLLTALKKLTVVRRPYPVVGVICPWNFPVMIALADAIPALAAGAAVVVKPSEFTPLATRRAIEGWQEIGAPDVFACVTGAGAAGAALVDAVDYVQFTGSTRTGKAIGARAAERLIPCSLELGGKDAAIVLADADLDRAVNGVVWGSLCNCGQACVAIERVYVEAPIHDEFVARVVEHVAALRQGQDGRGYDADVGALATTAQLEIVESQVRDAVGKGARALTGGARSALGGTFFEPTVLVDVDHTMDVMVEETFGPTLPIMKVTDADEAIRLANDSRYGLSATVWTADRERGRKIARRLEAGAVNLNDAFANLFTFGVPHSGWKQSGLGARLGGAYGIHKYCRAQSITESRLALRSELLWFPYTARKGRFVGALLRLLAARDLRRRLGRR